MKKESVVEFLKRLGYGPAPESPKPAVEWLEGHDSTFRHFVNGKWHDPVKGDYFDTVNPANGTVLAKVAYGFTEDVDAAVKAAAEAFPAWSKLCGHQRALYLYAIARAIARWARTFAVLETMDNGKPVRETRDIDVPLVIRHFYHHAGWAELVKNEFPLHRPGGVVAAVIPWNFPLLMLAWKIAPALAAGNTIVLKPAETTPLTALLFAEILKDEVGLPPGVVNIVTGAAETGKALVEHPTPWKVAFTGSTEVGRWIRKATAGTGKHLTMELGGKSPFIVFDDADIDSVVEGVVDAIWFNQGQVCCAGSRLLVQESVHDELVSRIRRRMETLRVGDPLDKCTDIGAINSGAQHGKIRALIDQGLEEGARIYQTQDGLWPECGWFVPPTLFTGVSPSMSIAQEEIFGPVLVVMSFRTPDEAVQLANNTVYGLAASVWTQNLDKAVDMAARVNAGVVWVNCANMFDANAPFGGNRQSGFGREGGREGMLEMLEGPGAKAVPHKSEKQGSEKAETGDEESPVRVSADSASDGPLWPVDRTLRLLVDGKLARPDGGTSFRAFTADGKLIADLPDANRKDVRNAVQAARGAVQGWASSAPHLRAQILYFLAENLSANVDRFARAIAWETGSTHEWGESEVRMAVEELFRWAAWADKFGGEVKPVIGRFHVTANYEPIGVVGARAPDDSPLLGFVHTVAPLLAMGNAVVAVAGKHAFTALELVQLVQCSDVPSGALSVLSARDPDALAKVLAEHMDVDGIWYFGTPEGSKMVEAASACNMKRTFVLPGDHFGWQSAGAMAYLRAATQVKTIWVPFGA